MEKQVTVLEDCTDGDLTEALKYAGEIKDDSLQECLAKLSRIDKNCNSHTKIYKDFAPHSFAFARMKDGECRTNGGIIFHGVRGEHGAGAPTFSVSIDNTPGWSVHT